MNIRHFFDNIDEKTIDRITEKYPPLSSDDKERLYAMSKNKYNSEKKENKNDYSEVMGVERYRKPVWQKVISAVAAAVVVLGGIGGGVLLLGKSGETDPISDIEVLQPEYDYTAIATELTDKLLEMENTICYGDISYDEYDRKVIDIVCSDDSAQFESPCEAILYKVTDPRFTCRRDLYDELRSVFTKQHYDENDFSTATIFGFDLNFYLGSELSDYIVDGKIDIAENFDNDDESICYAVYCDINGELYVRQCDFELSEYTSDVIIKETGENSFTATRSYIGDFVIGDGTSNRCFDFVLENGEWKIDKVYLSDEESEDVTESEDEYDYTAIATELSDKYLELENMVCYGGISYDENEMKSYTVYDSFDELELIFYKVTDPRFICEQDFYDEIRSIHTNQRYPDDNFTYTTFFAGCNLDSCFGGELSEYAANGRIDLAANYGNDNGYSLLGVYCYYNGELYVTPFDYDYELAEYTSDVIIKETGENSFTATRKFKSQLNSVGDYYKVFEIVLENGEWKIDEAYVSSEESENESEDGYDYTAIAQQLFDDYLEVESVIKWGDVSYDENDSITFYTYNSNDAEWADNNVGERTFYKVTDERFSSCQDIYEMLRAITTAECEPEENFMNADWFDQVNLSSSLGGDVSMFEVGENIDINHEISDWRWPGYSINRSVFVEYNGELYVNRRYNETPEFTSDVIINETSENSFTATRNYKSPVNSVEEYCILEFALENGEWKINHMLNN